MSASLVGSEMCIRDRCAATPPSTEAPSVPGPRAAAGRPVRVCARGRPAVSYTHLTLPTICSV
eukprot:10677348-Alexandrium_andersonii.AAC.1